MAQSNYDLCKQGFAAINNFKRHRTLRDNANTEVDRNFHELHMYKTFDSIELTMRAIQSNERFGSKVATSNRTYTTNGNETEVEEDEAEE